MDEEEGFNDYLVEGSLIIRIPLTQFKDNVTSGYGIVRLIGRHSRKCYFTRCTNDMRLLADILKPLFGLETMGYHMIKIKSKKYLICPSNVDITLDEYLNITGSLTNDEISNIRAIMFFRSALSMVRNNFNSIIVRKRGDEVIFISRDDRFVNEEDAKYGKQASNVPTSYSTILETESSRLFLLDLPIFRNMKLKQIDKLISSLHLSVKRLIQKYDSKMLWIWDIIRKYIDDSFLCCRNR